MKDLPAFILSIALIRCLIKLLFLFLEKKVQYRPDIELSPERTKTKPCFTFGVYSESGSGFTLGVLFGFP